MLNRDFDPDFIAEETREVKQHALTIAGKWHCWHSDLSHSDSRVCVSIASHKCLLICLTCPQRGDMKIMYENVLQISHSMYFSKYV